MRALIIIIRDLYGNRRISWSDIRTAWRYAKGRKGEKVMAKTCETCGKLIYDRGSEDVDQYCLDMNDLNLIPEPEESPDFECPDWAEDITQ
jgi:hypothetical protein